MFLCSRYKWKWIWLFCGQGNYNIFIRDSGTSEKRFQSYVAFLPLSPSLSFSLSSLVRLAKPKQSYLHNLYFIFNSLHSPHITEKLFTHLKIQIKICFFDGKKAQWECCCWCFCSRSGEMSMKLAKHEISCDDYLFTIFRLDCEKQRKIHGFLLTILM